MLKFLSILLLFLAANSYRYKFYLNKDSTIHPDPSIFSIESELEHLKKSKEENLLASWSYEVSGFALTYTEGSEMSFPDERHHYVNFENSLGFRQNIHLDMETLTTQLNGDHMTFFSDVIGDHSFSESVDAFVHGGLLGTAIQQALEEASKSNTQYKGKNFTYVKSEYVYETQNAEAKEPEDNFFTRAILKMEDSQDEIFYLNLSVTVKDGQLKTYTLTPADFGNKLDLPELKESSEFSTEGLKDFLGY